MPYKITLYQWDPTDLYSNVNMELKIENITNKKLNKTRIELLENSFFACSNGAVPVLAPYSSCLVKIYAQVKGQLVPNNIPDRCIFRINGETQSFSINCYSFTKEFLNFGYPNGDESLGWNIYLFGLPGSTKSSFVNTISTIFSPEPNIKCVADVSSFAAHCTTKLVRYGITPNINLWDTWGLGRTNFNSKVLSSFIKGELPVGYKMQDQSFASFENSYKRVCHSIIYFLPQAAINDEEEFSMIKSCFLHFKECRPIIVVTKLDEREVNLRNNPLGTFDSVEQTIKLVASKLGTPLFNIFYCVNYKDETKRNMGIEKLAYSILHRAMLNRNVEKENDSNEYCDY